MMNGIFGALTVVFIYLIARRLFDRRVGVAAGALLAIFPSQVFYTGVVLSEAMFTMLMVLALLVLMWNPWRREGMPYKQLFLAGLILSAATMTRGITLLLPLVLLGIWFFYLESRKRALLQTLVVFAGIAVLIVPWSIRNSIVFGTVVGPSTNLGDDLCIGNFQGATGAFLITGKCFEGFEGKTGEDFEIARSRHGTETAIKDVVQHPMRMPVLIAHKAYWLLFHDEDGLWAAESYGNDWFISHPRREILQFAANAIYYATGLVMIAGAAAFALSKDLRKLFVLLTMLYILAIPLGFFGDPRFHFPAIPLAVVIAAATLIAFWDRRKPIRQTPEATT
jgi:4-amino-4-deoxy-L-arabinose transferase-like glycosyltransferase